MKPNRIDSNVDSIVCTDLPANKRQTKSMFILWGHSWYRLPGTEYILKVGNVAPTAVFNYSLRNYYLF